MATPNIFDRARNSKPDTKPKVGKSEKERVELQGLEEYAYIVGLEKNLEAVKETLYDGLVDELRTKFSAVTNGKRPANFRGVEGHAEASCELRNRSVNSPLSDEEAKLLDDSGIEYEILEIVPERFVINPEFAADHALMQRVAKALESVKGLPENFIQMQAAQTKRVVSDETIEQTFTKDPEVIQAVIDTVGAFAIKPKLSEEIDAMAAIKAVKKITKEAVK